MATTYYTDIQKLYVAYFNRPADVAGLAYWETVVEGAKGSTAAVSASFAGSAEYKATYANMTNAQIVDAVYQNLFGRAAEDAGKAYWADLLDKKAITIDNVVSAVSNAALGSDKTSFSNKVTAASAFTAALDTPAEQAGYTAASVSLAKQYIAGVTTDASLAAAITPATLNATVSAVVIKGTPFSLTGALSTYNAANKAVADFLDAADGTADGTISPDAATVRASIATKYNTTVTAVDNAVTGDYTNSSATVKAALLNEQISVNNTALINAQTSVGTANTNIAKVAGLSAAISTYTSAVTTATAAVTAQTTAAADLAGKLASYNALSGTTVTVGADGQVANLIVLDTNNKLVLKSGVTETTNPGITALLNASIAKEAADATVTSTATARDTAKATVDYLDMSTAEKSDLTAILALMKDVSVTTGSLPTLAQIAAQKSILDAKAAASGATQADADAKAAFDTAVGTYNTDAAKADANPLYKALTDANSLVTAAQGTIKTLNDAVTAMNSAKTSVDTLAGLDATVTAATNVFGANNLATPVTVTGSLLATAGSDIFVAGKANGAINLFGLTGSDSLYVGSNYVLNTGKIATAGNDSALEVFVAQNGSDTTLKIEQHAFSSSVSGAPVSEIVTITLQGVTATDVHLNNGIITVGGTTA